MSLACLPLSDTICDLGGVNELANYGEYSGAPSEQQTYDYAKTILSLMTREKHPEGKGEPLLTMQALVFSVVSCALLWMLLNLLIMTWLNLGRLPEQRRWFFSPLGYVGGFRISFGGQYMYIVSNGPQLLGDSSNWAMLWCNFVRTYFSPLFFSYKAKSWSLEGALLTLQMWLPRLR